MGTEYVSAKRSKGEILVFKRSAVPTLKEQEDEEAAPVPAGRNSAADLTGSDESEKNYAILKQTAVFHWKDVTYDIKIKGKPRRLLDHVDGWVKPGTLTALMVRPYGIYYQGLQLITITGSIWRRKNYLVGRTC